MSVSILSASIVSDQTYLYLDTSQNIGRLTTSSSISVADDSTVNITNSCYSSLISISAASGHGALFYASYTGLVQEIKDYNNYFADTDTDGYACVYKSTNSHTVTFKNRRGSTLSFYFNIFGKQT